MAERLAMLAVALFLLGCTPTEARTKHRLLLVDLSKSSEKVVEYIRTNAGSLAGSMVKGGHIVSLVTFSDYPYLPAGYPEDHAFKLEFQRENKIATLEAAFRKLKVLHGGDTKESGLEALYLSLTGKKRNGAGVDDFRVKLESEFVRIFVLTDALEFHQGTEKDYPFPGAEPAATGTDVKHLLDGQSQKIVVFYAGTKKIGTTPDIPDHRAARLQNSNEPTTWVELADQVGGKVFQVKPDMSNFDTILESDEVQAVLRPCALGYEEVEDPFSGEVECVPWCPASAPHFDRCGFCYADKGMALESPCDPDNTCGPEEEYKDGCGFCYTTQADLNKYRCTLPTGPVVVPRQE